MCRAAGPTPGHLSVRFFASGPLSHWQLLTKNMFSVQNRKRVERKSSLGIYKMNLKGRHKKNEKQATSES